MMDRYICAFRGRRDGYQVPLALAEADMLETLITDAYTQPWMRGLAQLAPDRLREKMEFRSEPGILSERVKCLWATTALEHFRHRLGYAPMDTYGKLDRCYARAAGRRAAQTRSHLFLYSPYAWDAFTRSYGHRPKKVLFQYHPHPALERHILGHDRVCHPDIGESFSGSVFGQAAESLEHEAWKYADLIFCASSFTRRSLLEVGADERKCRVVPYGVELPPVAPALPPMGGSFKVLFVGSGGQRKGLHHLLHAWAHATLPANSRLTLVCRVVDRGIAALVASTPRVELLSGVSPDALVTLYRSSSILALPSLVEGFGQVYLEALAQGCPVLGTANTGLPDLGREADGIFLVTPGNVDELILRLETLARDLPAQPELRACARACASRFTWAVFRAKLRSEMQAALP